MTCTRESIIYWSRYMELQQLLKEPQVHEHPAWPASIRLWQLSWNTYRLIPPPIVTTSIVMVNWGWKQSNFIRTWVGFELTYFGSWSNDANPAPRHCVNQSQIHMIVRIFDKYHPITKSRVHSLILLWEKIYILFTLFLCILFLILQFNLKLILHSTVLENYY